MERLTEWKDDKKLLAKTKFSGDFGSANVLNRLAEYEDLEEQGLLLRLPCKVGSTVYHIANKRILEVENVDLFFLCLCVAECRFGKSVFLTQEEAEQKLKEMNTDNGITE